MRDKRNHNGQKETIQMDILPKWQAGRDFCQNDSINIFKNTLDYADL